MLSLLLYLLPTTLLLYSLLLVIYRLTFHPLAKFPGPKLAAATKWYEFYHDIIKGHGLFAEQIRQMHKVYGPIVRINQDELHIDDPDWYEVLYAQNPTRRDKWPPAAMTAGTWAAGHGTVEHTLHGKRRAALRPLFSQRAIAGANVIMQEQVQILADTLHRKYIAGEVVELRSVFVAFATDTIYQYAMGDSMGLQNDERRARRWWWTLEAVSKMTPMAKQFPWMLPLGQKMPLGLIQRLKPEMAGLLGIHKEMYARAGRYLEHEEEGNSEKKGVPPVFRAIRDSVAPAHEKNVHRLAQEGFLVIVAGGETTGRMLELGVYYILSNSSVLQRLQEEAASVMPDVSKTPSTEALKEASYLNAVVKEILRISAVITTRLPLMADEELIYKDWIIPRRTPVSLTPSDVLLDPRVFTAPSEFDPDRWNHDPDLDRYFVPFGKGTRMCQGMKFALAELNLALLTVFRRFDLELYETTKERDVDYVGDLFLGAHHPESLGVRIKVVGVRT